MKKAVNWILAIVAVAFVIDWGVVGLKILDGDYDFQAGLYIGLACWAILIGCLLYKRFSHKCPHCGTGGAGMLGGSFCPYCGKQLEQ